MWKFLKITAIVLTALVVLAVVILGIPRIYFGPTLPRANYKQQLQTLCEQVVTSQAEGKEVWECWEGTMRLHQSLYTTLEPSLDPERMDAHAYVDVVDIAKALDGDQGKMQRAQELLALAGQRGLFDKLAVLRESPAYLRPPSTALMFMDKPFDIDGVRPLARLLRLRLREAIARHDAEVTLASVRDILTVARLVGSEPFLIRRLIAQATACLVLEELKLALDAGTLSAEAIEQLIREMEAFRLPPVSFTLDGETIGAHEVFATNLKDTRLKFMNRSYQSTLLDECMAILKKHAEAPARDRVQDPSLPFYTNWPLSRYDMAPTAMLVPAVGRAAAADDNFWCEFHGALLRLAIERYRMQHNQPPAQLVDLVPEVLAQIPSDPMSPSGYIYRRTSDGNEYVLYSVALDGIDNAGRAHATPVEAFRRLGRGYDFVFHAPSPPPEPN